MKLLVKHYFKKKGERGYKKQSSSVVKDSTIDDYLVFFPTGVKKRNPDNIVKTKYVDYGTTYKRIIKNKRTGNSTMLVLKEFY